MVSINSSALRLHLPRDSQSLPARYYSRRGLVCRFHSAAWLVHCENTKMASIHARLRAGPLGRPFAKATTGRVVVSIPDLNSLWPIHDQDVSSVSVANRSAPCQSKTRAAGTEKHIFLVSGARIPCGRPVSRGTAARLVDSGDPASLRPASPCDLVLPS